MTPQNRIIPQGSQASPIESVAPLAVTGLSFSYNGDLVLDDVHFELGPGTLTAVIGPNGAGKSTLLKNVLSLLTPQSGVVKFFGNQTLKQSREDVVYVPQRAEVDWTFPITVLEVAMQGQYPKLGRFRRFLKSHRQIAFAALMRVGMSEFAEKQISELSGGQQQRVFLARAIAQDGELYILDEPFAGIDFHSEELITSELKELRRRGKTLLIVHHDLNTIHKIFDNVIVLNCHVVASGPMSLLTDPAIVAEAYRSHPGKYET